MMLLQILMLLLARNCMAFDLSDEEYDSLPQLFSLENYDKCLRYNGTYCLLRLDLFAEEGNELMKLIRNYSQNHHIKHFNYTYVERGVCVSTTCKDFIGDKDLNDPAQLHEVVQSCSNHSVWTEYGLFADVTSELCDRKSDGLDIDALDWAVLGAILVIVAINVVGTLYDLLVDNDEKAHFGKGKQMLLCFSVMRNLRHLMAPAKSDPKLDTLKGINAFRNIGSFAIIVAHSALILLGGFIDNPHDLEKVLSRPHYELTMNGTFIVQIFFVIASFLLVYNLEMTSETNKITWSSIPKIYLFRFWRLTPPLALLLGFSATWLRHLGSGPLWQRNVVSVVHQCRQYWWTHLLYINNYFTDNVVCAKHTWQLAADTQLFLVALVVYVATKNRGRNVTLAILLILGMIFPALHVWMYNLDLNFFFAPEMSRQLGDDNFKYNFCLGHTNIAGYVVGMYTGYKMYDWHKKGTNIQLSTKTILIVRALTTGFLLYMTHLITLINTDDVSLGVRMAFQAVLRVVTSAAMSMMIMLLSVNLKDSILDWNIWVYMGRISYSLFLLHLNVLHLIVGLRTQLDHLHYLNFFMVQLGFYFLSVGLAIPFYLLVEAPMTPLLKILLSSSEKKKKKLVAATNEECKENGENTFIIDNDVNDIIEEVNQIENVEKIKSL